MSPSFSPSVSVSVGVAFCRAVAVGVAFCHAIAVGFPVTNGIAVACTVTVFIFITLVVQLANRFTDGALTLLLLTVAPGNRFFLVILHPPPQKDHPLISLAFLQPPPYLYDGANLALLSSNATYWRVPTPNCNLSFRFVIRRTDQIMPIPPPPTTTYRPSSFFATSTLSFFFFSF
jgi:hypothetical protein